MSRFLRIEGESAWVNISHIDAIFVRPQLEAEGQSSGIGTLESLHHATGVYELGVMFQGHVRPVKTFGSRAEAESFVEDLLSQLG